MNLIHKFLAPKAQEKSAEQPTFAARSVTLAREIGQPQVASSNFMELFRTIPEVYWPIHYLASRIAGAHFELKKASDDSVVWCNRRFNNLVAAPNCLMGWYELVYTHFVYRLATGNAYMRATVEESAMGMPRYKTCNNFWALPAQCVYANPASNSVPLFGVCDESDLVKSYTLQGYGRANMTIPTWQVWHDRDSYADMHANASTYLKSPSRLLSVLKPISNLVAVYEARNVIYVKRGGIGFLVSRKQDVTGSVPMTPDEKQDVLDQLQARYGVTDGKSPIGVTDVPMDFIRTNLSISELQPFDETLEDAIKIAGAFGIPAVLVPRKDQSTFANQSTAEKGVYSSVIIPMAKKFCEDMTVFLGLDRDKLYLDCSFADVDCLQEGLLDLEKVKKMQIERALTEFGAGLRTLNDIRAMMHESQIPADGEGAIPLFSKLKYEMTAEELAQVNAILGKTITTTSTTSTGEENERKDEELGVRDQGK